MIVAFGFLMSAAVKDVFALPADNPVNTLVSTSPFHDCLSSGSSFNDCRQAARVQRSELKRDTISSSSPFHDCISSEGTTWADCTLKAGLTPRAMDSISADASDLATRDSEVTERGLPFTFKGVVDVLGQKLGGSEQCYSTNNLGGTGWLTNKAVNGLKMEACTFAVNQAIQAGTGKFSATKPGFYQGGGGPIASPKVKFFMSVLLTGAQFSGVPNLDIKQLGIDLCAKGVDHLTGDSGCTAARKAGLITSHTSVNGGEFDWAPEGATPEYNNMGICTNCILTMIMEAANMVNKDGVTAIPISG